jgi:glycosyltransferase involved in cell wall biosynthesis
LPAKVLILSNVPSPYLSPVYAQLKAESGWDVTICYTSSWNAAVGWTPAQAASFASSSADVMLAAKYPRLVQLGGEQVAASVALLSLLFKVRPDYLLIYGYTLLPQMLLIGWAFLTGTPFAIAGDANFFSDHARGWRRKLKSLWLGWLARRAAALMTVGTACRMFWESFGARAERLFHTGFAVNNDHFRQASAAQADAAANLRQQFGWTEHTVYLFVGRLIERKNVHLIIEAARQLHDLPVAVLIAGDGPERQTLEQLADGNPNIRFVGTASQTELPLYYAAADVLVLPAREEPWGLVVNEAMTCGLAVIAHEHCGATLDLVAPDNGVILQTYTVEELREAMRALASDAVKLQACQKRSAEKIQAWTMPQAAAQLRDAIAVTLGQRG